MNATFRQMSLAVFSFNRVETRDTKRQAIDQNICHGMDAVTEVLIAVPTSEMVELRR